jgi:hypothetical protein
LRCTLRTDWSVVVVVRDHGVLCRLILRTSSSFSPQWSGQFVTIDQMRCLQTKFEPSFCVCGYSGAHTHRNKPHPNDDIKQILEPTSACG